MTAFVPEDILKKIRQYQTQSKDSKLFEGLDDMAAQRRALAILETYAEAEDYKYERSNEDCRIIFDCERQLDPTIDATIRQRMKSPIEDGVPIEDIFGEDWDKEKPSL